MEKLPKGRGDSVAKGGWGGGVILGIFLGCGKCNYCKFQLHLGHSVPVSIECRRQSLFSLYSFSSCLQGVYFLFP